MIYGVNRKTKAHRVLDSLMELTKSERLVVGDDAGWIEWGGRSKGNPRNPLPDGTRCDTRRIGDRTVAREVARDRQNWQCVTHYRPILDDKPDSPEWDGESWPPPIRSVIESSVTWKDGTPVEVLAVRHGNVIGCHTETGVAGWLVQEHCRPLRTAAQREEEEAVEAMHQIADDTPGSEAGDVFRAFYRAIRDGKIPGIKLEDAQEQSAGADAEQRTRR